MSKPPPQPESGTWEEYRLHHVESIKWLTEEVRSLHDDVLTLKLKVAVAAIGFGTASSIVTAIAIHIITRGIKP